MQIVIDIPEEIVTDVKDYCGMSIADAKEALPIILNAIHNGIPLPKGHGKLVDIDLLRDQVIHDEREAFSKHQVWLLLSVHNKKIPTIIEADR